MYTYVWGILISAFVIDILKHNYQKEMTENKTNSQPFPGPEKESGMQIKLDGQQDLEVKYDGRPLSNQNISIKFQYCTS